MYKNTYYPPDSKIFLLHFSALIHTLCRTNDTDMTTGMMIMIVTAAVAVAAAAMFVVHNMYRQTVARLEREHEKSLQSVRNEYEKAMQAQKDGYERVIRSQKEGHESAVSAMRDNYESSLKEIRENYEKSLSTQIKAVKDEMTARTEEILKAREAELDRNASEVFRNITGNLTKDLQAMKKSFDDTKEMQVKTATDLGTRMELAVRQLREQSESIGSKADSLADALRGQNKIQGCWGETLLENILKSEGFVEGRDYDREATLTGELGETVRNPDSGKKMRPDFIIHYPDKTDIVVDSKVDLSAYSDYVSAKTEEERVSAAKRNLAAITAQIDSLSRKDYSSYLPAGRKNLGYVLMFIPVYGALQLAKTADKDLWRNAFARNVLIVTEETLIPFLRMIRTAWISVEQVRNQNRIIASARNMIDRVHDFMKYHKAMGTRLKDAMDCYESCESKLKDSGPSIVTSARQVIALGVPEKPGKRISDVDTAKSLE